MNCDGAPDSRYDTPPCLASQESLKQPLTGVPAALWTAPHVPTLNAMCVFLGHDYTPTHALTSTDLSPPSRDRIRVHGKLFIGHLDVTLFCSK